MFMDESRFEAIENIHFVKRRLGKCYCNVTVQNKIRQNAIYPHAINVCSMLNINLIFKHNNSSFEK